MVLRFVILASKKIAVPFIRAITLQVWEGDEFIPGPAEFEETLV